jgi:hypothetical protein
MRKDLPLGMIRDALLGPVGGQATGNDSLVDVQQLARTGLADTVEAGSS